MARLTGTKALACIAVLIVSVLFAAPLVVLATSPTTVEIDGTYDFEVDEVVSGTSGSEWFFTWDDDNFYFGTDNDNIDDNNGSKWVLLYIDVDPQENPLSGNGTSTGQSYDNQTPGLPFNADYHFRWKTNNLYTNIEEWDGSNWVDAGATFGSGQDAEVYQNLEYFEGRISLSFLGDPSSVYVVGTMIDQTGGGEWTYYMTPDSNGPDGYDQDFTNYFGFVLVDDVPPNHPANLDCHPGITVANTNDSGSGSLREALGTVCYGGTITATATGTITLGSQLLITPSLSLNGPGAGNLAISGSDTYRVFSVTEGISVTLSDIAIARGSADGGGGIFNHGRLSLNRCVVRDNAAPGTAGFPASRGGGIQNRATGQLSLNDCSLYGNSAGRFGGAIYNLGTLEIYNSAVYSNTAEIGGGGIEHGGEASLDITNSTISGNSTSSAGDAEGGGIEVYNGTATLVNTTIVNNTTNGSPGAGVYANDTQGALVRVRGTILADNDRGGSTDAVDFGGTLTSQGYNLVESTSGFTITGNISGNILGVDPKLLSLQDNGGPSSGTGLATWTHAPDTDSPVIDVIPAASCPVTIDQRGVERHADGYCEIGAYEVEPPCRLTVSSTADSGPGTLRQLMVDICDGGVIDFAPELATETITLTSRSSTITQAFGMTALPAVTKTMVISGNGVTIQRSLALADTLADSFRLFYVGDTGDLTLYNLTLRNGFVRGGDGSGGGGGAAGMGGAIFNDRGSLTLDSVTLAGNVAQGGDGETTGSGGGGGGVGASSAGAAGGEPNGGADGVAGGFGGGGGNGAVGGFGGGDTSTGSFGGGGSENGGGGYGGAVFNLTGTLQIVNTTLYSNAVAGGVGTTGGDGIGGAVFNLNGTAIIVNSTLVSNTVAAGSGGTPTTAGGGLYSMEDSSLDATGNDDNSLVDSATLVLTNTIIANSTGAEDCQVASGGSSGSNNLVESHTGCPGGSVTGDPQLGPLQDNGGDTPTMALVGNSSAVDAGTSSGAPDVDQRGALRPFGAAHDIGAYETGANLVIDKAVIAPPVLQPGDWLTYTLTFSNTGLYTATQVVITDIVPITNTSVISSLTGLTLTARSEISHAWDSLVMAPGVAGIITVTGQVSETYGAEFTNTATITMATTAESFTEDNRASVTSTVNTLVTDLEVEKVIAGGSEQTVLAGDDVTYTLTITNNGPKTTDAVVVDTVAGDITDIVSATTGTGVCSVPGATSIRCDYAALTGTETITLVLTTAASFSGTLTNTAEITFGTGFVGADPVAANNSSVVTATVRYPAANLEIEKRRESPPPDGEPVLAGEAITYTVVITNNGPDTAVGIVLTDQLPLSTTLNFPDTTNLTNIVEHLDDEAADFNAGEHDGTYWNDGWLRLQPPVSASGVFTSRVFDATNVGPWDVLSWVPERRYGWPLPDNQAVESGYAEGEANMVGNRVLLHLDTPDAYVDTSGNAIEVGCPVSPTIESCPTSGVDGKFGTALGFDGALSQTVMITDTENPMRYSLELWVRPTVVTDTSLILRSDMISGPLSHTAQILGIMDERFMFAVRGEDGAMRVITGTTVVAQDTWYHVVAMAAGNGYIKLYVNGEEEAHQYGIGALWRDGDHYRLGAGIGITTGATTEVTGTAYFSGDMDEVAIYERTMRASEVEDHYLRGALRLGFQVRAFDTLPGAGVLFIGPDGTSTTYFTDQRLDDSGTVTAALSMVGDARYFQYRAYLETDDYVGTVTNSPAIEEVRVEPDHRVMAASQGQCTVAPTYDAFTCTLGSLASGGVISVTTPVYIDEFKLGVITNTVTVTSQISDTSLVNNVDWITDTVIGQAELEVRKFAEDLVNRGAPLLYELRVYNHGPSGAYSATVTDTLPLVIDDFVAGDGWGCDAVGQAITCTLANLGVGTWQEVAAITVTAPVTDGVISNTVWITTTGGITYSSMITPTDRISDTIETEIAALADLVLLKEVSHDPVSPGDIVTYTLTVTNTGPLSATNVIITDTFVAPPSLLGGIIAGPEWSTCTVGSAQVLSCTLVDPLEPGQGASLQITTTAPTSGTLTNYALVLSDETDPNTDDNDMMLDVDVLRVTDLTLRKEVTPTTVIAGSTLTYTLTLTNAGPVDAGASDIDRTFNGNGIIVPGTVSGEYQSNLNVGIAGSVRDITVTLNNLIHTYPSDMDIRLVSPSGVEVMLMSNVGSGTELEGLTLTFNDTSTETLPFTDTLLSSVVYQPTAYDEAGTPSHDDLGDLIGRQADGTWRLYIADNFASDGGELDSWSLALRIRTPDRIILSDTLPSGVGEVVPDLPGSWYCDPVTDGELYCESDTLLVNAPEVITLSVTAPITGGVITNTAFITATTTDLGPLPNTDSVTATVISVADIGIVKTASAEKVDPGDALTYTLVVTNAGLSLAEGVVVSDSFAGLPFSVATVDSNVTLTQVGTPPAYQWQIPPIAPDGMTVITVTGQVSTTVALGTVFTNTATITATTWDTDTTNNWSAVSVTVSMTPTCFARLGTVTYESDDARAVQEAVDAAVAGDEISVSGICAGVQDVGGSEQVVYIDKSLTLRGGYTNTEWTTYDPLVYSTTLDALGGGRVVRITGGSAVTVAGLNLVNGVSSGDGAGLWSDGALVISRTTFAGNVTTGSGGGVYHTGSDDAYIVNTLFARNAAGGDGEAVDLTSSGHGEVVYTTISSPTQVIGAAVHVANGTVGITNTIITSHTTGIQETSGTASEDYNLFYQVTTAVIGVTQGGHSITDDPAFLDMDNDNYHLDSISQAIGQGTDLGVPVDFDGDARPGPNGSVDVGYDEADFVVDVQIVKTVQTPRTTVVPSDTLTYTLAYTNAGDYTATGVVITDVVPVTLTQVVSDSSGAVLTARSGVTYAWDVANLAPNASGLITITGVVSPALVSDTTFINQAAITTTLVDTTTINNSSAISVAVVMPQVQFSQDTYYGVSTYGTATITITLTPVNPNLDVTVIYSTSNGTATAPGDYGAISDTLVITRGLVSANFTMPITNSGTVLLDLFQPQGAVLGAIPTATLVISDTPPVFFESALYTVTEDVGPAVDYATITATLGAPSNITATVAYTTVAGTALAGADYVAATGVLTFNPGVMQQVFTVTVVDDVVNEPDETLTLWLGEPVSATLLTPYTATLTIVDNDDLAVQFDRDDYVVDEDAVSALITATLSTTSTWQTVAVSYTTQAGTATADEDYVSIVDSLQFLPGTTTLVFTVPITDDVLYELDETVRLTLSNVTSTDGSAIITGTLPVTLTIVDNDLAPTISITDAAALEDAGSLPFTVTLSTMSSLSTTVEYSTTDNTAVAGADYTTVTGTLTIPAGDTTATIDVPITDDAIDEGDETFTVNLGNPVGATLAVTGALGTIMDDDTSGLVITPTTIILSEDGVTDTYTLVLESQPSQAVTVTLTTDGQVTSSLTTVTFLTSTWNIAQPMVVTAVDDVLVEATPHNGVLTHTLTSDDAFYGALGVISVTAVITDNDNSPPVAVADVYTTAEDVVLTVAAPGVLDNDSDPDIPTVTQVLTASLAATPLTGTLSFAQDGSFVYTPTLDFNGVVTFTYYAGDGLDLSDLATVTVIVTAVNDTPVAVNDAYTTPEEVTLTVVAPGVLDNDLDVDGDSLTAVVADDVVTGTLDFAADGGFVYTPTLDFSGVVTFTYYANDGVVDSNIATVVITVTGENDAPVAVSDAYTTTDDVALVVAAPGVLDNDSDPDGDALTAVLDDDVVTGALALATGGGFVYTPTLGSTGLVTFTYHANDGALDSNVALVVITVTTSNGAPVAVDDVYTTSEDVALSIAAPGVLDNDSDPNGDILTAVLDNDVNSGTLALSVDGGFVYTPALEFSGVVLFTYHANDGELDSNVATVTITVTGENDAPITVDDAYTTTEGARLTITAPGILSNDQDPDGDTLTATLQTGPSHGSLTLDATGGFVYTPTMSFVGQDSFTYLASDGEFSTPGTVTITVARRPGYTIFLPLLLRYHVTAPDLVVEDIVATSDDIMVVIKNQGVRPVTADVANEFWVDLYVDPHTVPSAVNDIWEDFAAEGIVWGVTVDALPLDPGESLTLTMQPRDEGGYYWPERSNITFPLVAGTPIYAHVDSAHNLTDYGAVIETHEYYGGAYNNITGPVASTSMFKQQAFSELYPVRRLLNTFHNLPPRP